MNKEAFLSKLGLLLSSLPAEEREKALRYYDEYISDAGEENEAQVLADLGSPEQIAGEILKNITAAEHEQKKSREFKGLTPFSSIHAELVNASILLQNGDEFSVRLPETDDDDMSAFTYEVKNDTLYIKEDTLKLGIHFFSDLFKAKTYQTLNRRVIVTLPKQTYNKFHLETVSGGITASDIELDTLHAETTNGGTSFKNITADKLHMESVNGGLSASDISSADLYSECVNGAINLSGTLTGKIHAECVNGAITINTTAILSDCDWCLETVCGSIRINDEKFKGRQVKRTNAPVFINAESVNGGIRLHTK